MIREFLRYGPALLSWAGLAYKLPAFCKDRENPVIRAYWSALFVLALALTILLPSVYLTIDRVTGIDNLARLFAHGLILVAGWLVQLFLFHLNYDEVKVRSLRRRNLWILAAALVLLVSLFALAHTEEDPFGFNSRYADSPFVLEYRLVFMAYPGYILINMIRLSWRYATISKSRPLLSLGLRMVSLGGYPGLAYIAHGILYSVLRRVGFDYTMGREEMISQALIAGTVVPVLIGSTMPAWGTRLGILSLHRFGSQYLSLWRLYPLWSALALATPEVTLFPTQSRVGDALNIRDLSFRLYRRVIETRDGYLALQPYFDARVVECAHALCLEAGIAGEQTDATVEAATIAVALRAKANGRVVKHSGTLRKPFGGGDVPGEISALELLAEQFQHSRIVRTVLANWEQNSSDSLYDTKWSEGKA